MRRFTVREEDLDSYVSTLASDAQQRVRTTLARTKIGFSTDIVTPLIGKSNEDKSGARAAFRDMILKKVVPSNFEVIDQAEISQAAKVGPLSIMLPFAERLEDIYRYYSVPSEGIRVDVNLLERAFSRVVTKLPKHELKPLSIEQAFETMPRGTNLGGPFFSRSSDYYPQLLDLAHKIERDGWNCVIHPCMLYWRGQSTGLTSVPKQRVVWGYPHYISIHELRLQNALLPILRKLPQFCALVDSDAVNMVVSEMINMQFLKLSVDYSGFDTTVPNLLTRMAFDVVRHTFKRSASRMIDFVEDVFHNIPLLNPSGVWHGIHTVPSGSVWTNQIDSLCQWIKAEYCALVMNNQLIRSTFQGDDGVWMFRDKWALEDVRDIASQFGMHISSDKGGVSLNDVFYLQNVHTRGYVRDGLYVGVRPLERALTGMLSFETARDKQWRPVDTSFRWLQQAESCRENEHLYVLAQILVENDRLIREFNIRELVLIGGGLDEIEARQKAKGFPYGKESLRGVYKFRIVEEIEKYKGVPLSGSRVA